MVKYILFLDLIRQEEVDLFYTACQMQREYLKGYPNSHHPLTFFKDREYAYQCAPAMPPVYLDYPAYHVKYKQPVALPPTTDRTSGFPPLPGRTLSGRYNKAACQVYVR